LGVANIAVEKIGLPIPTLILDPSTNDNTVLIQGVNYASGGGDILNETGYHFVITTQHYSLLWFFFG